MFAVSIAKDAIPSVHFTTMLLAVLVQAALAAASCVARTCSSDADCNLNGVCSHHQCKCDAGWKGADCGALDLYPASRKAGHNNTGSGESTWGNHIVQDPTDRHLYHLFYSSMENDCGLLSWIPYSRVMHAVSRTGPEGPYVNATEAIGTFSHNPTIVWSPADKKYLMYHIGCPQAVQPGCNGASGSMCANDLAISVHSSTNLASWKSEGLVLKGDGGSAWDALITNPSAWPLQTSARDHTMILAYRGKDSNKNERLNVAYSKTGFKGPYTKIGSEPIFTPLAEDPFVWKDKRGNFHLLMHAFTDGLGGTPDVKQVGRHAYAKSYKGPWTYNNNTLAYGAEVEFTDGTSINFRRRERPQLYFSDDGKMTPLLLSSGVAENGSNQSYSIIAPIGHKSALA